MLTPLQSRLTSFKLHQPQVPNIKITQEQIREARSHKLDARPCERRDFCPSRQRARWPSQRRRGRRCRGCRRPPPCTHHGGAGGRCGCRCNRRLPWPGWSAPSPAVGKSKVRREMRTSNRKMILQGMEYSAKVVCYWHSALNTFIPIASNQMRLYYVTP